jgi:ATP-binding cassette, subfamily B, bacterial
MSPSAGSIGQTVQFPDLRSPAQLASSGWRAVPRLTRDALRVAWQASRRELLLALGMQTLAGGAMTLQLLAARHVLFELLALNENTHSSVGLIPSFVILIGAMVVMGATMALAEQRQRLLAEMVAQHALRQIIGISTRVELAAFENPDFHDQLERARGSAITRSVQMVMAVSGVTTNVLASAGVAFALLLMEPLLVPLLMVAAVPLLLATVRNSRHAYTFEWAMTPENRERTYLMELLTRREAATEIRVFGATAFLRSRYDRLSAERLRRMREFLRKRLATTLAGSVATSIGLGLALVALAALISSGRIEVATALTAGAAMQRLSSSLFAAMSAIGQLVESGMFVDDYNSFVRLLPEAEEPEAEKGGTIASADERPASKPRARFHGVRVEDISFHYPAVERAALKNVSIRVDPGEVVALVGENGSGKTTLVKLICQLYEPDAGTISWAGANGSAGDPSEIRDDMTVIFQDFLHYYLTAADNIALGRVQRDPTPEAVRDAARRAGADKFLNSLPDGYETRLGRQFQDGHDLSIGQWQRLSLARAFFRGGGFLVLDEPTAALDPKAEYALFQEMRKLWSGRAVLLVSHRFSSVRSADRIYVLHEGEVIEEGPHASLMAAEGHYAELFSLQAAAYLDQPGDDPPERKNAPPLGVSRI